MMWFVYDFRVRQDFSSFTLAFRACSADFTIIQHFAPVSMRKGTDFPDSCNSTSLLSSETVLTSSTGCVVCIWSKSSSVSAKSSTSCNACTCLSRFLHCWYQWSCFLQYEHDVPLAGHLFFSWDKPHLPHFLSVEYLLFFISDFSVCLGFAWGFLPRFGFGFIFTPRISSPLISFNCVWDSSYWRPISIAFVNVRFCPWSRSLSWTLT